jgi:23S rRNA pseudouridine1911/1915/1917 synthase
MRCLLIAPMYFRAMQEFTASHPIELIEALMTHVGYATRTRARNAMKRGEVLVNGKVVSRGSDILEPGAQVSILSKEETTQRERTGGTAPKSPSSQANSALLRAPFPVVYEDDNVFIYEKPAGWVCASANPKVKTTYSAVKGYLEAKSAERVDVHFVNKLPREASGLLVVAKSLEWRKHLQEEWNSFAQGLYVLVQGHLPADDDLFLRPENGEPYALPYRTMRATNQHTLLKFKAGYEVIGDLLPALRKQDCMLIGVGKTAPDPIKRGGIHLFALALKGPNNEVINVKTRVPNEFLKLVRGGSSPKPGPRPEPRASERTSRKPGSRPAPRDSQQAPRIPGPPRGKKKR